MLIRVVKNWTYPDLLRQTLDCNGVWGNIRFTLEPVDECDALLVFNELRENLTVSCPPEKVWAIFQEPYYPDFFPWLKEGHKQFAHVYTHHPPNADLRYRVAPPLVPWHVGKTYSELTRIETPLKNKSDLIVWVTSSSQELPGHLKRYAFYKFLNKLGWPDLDVWGRGIRPIEDKWNALAHSRYAIAVENYCGADYWTEKIADCWLADTLPFYYGCPNLEDYFPAESFVRIDLDNFVNAASIIRRMVDAGEYEKRLPAIREARDLILNRYQFFPFMAKEFRGIRTSSSAETIHLSAYRQSPISRLRSLCCQRYHQLKVRGSH
jgi:hypothetical protein